MYLSVYELKIHGLILILNDVYTYFSATIFGVKQRDRSEELVGVLSPGMTSEGHKMRILTC